MAIPKALLERLYQLTKISGTGRTIQYRQPFIKYLQSLGGGNGRR